jgi:hypothetical protein
MGKNGSHGLLNIEKEISIKWEKYFFFLVSNLHYSNPPTLHVFPRGPGCESGIYPI